MTPVITFILSILIGANDYWGKMKWLSVVAFGVMYMLAAYVTFSVANTQLSGNINPPEWGMILAGGIVSAVGLVIGVVIKILKRLK